jgi:hypothetical protein
MAQTRGPDEGPRAKAMPIDFFNLEMFLFFFNFIFDVKF